MKLSMGLGYTGDPKAAARRAREFESAGIDMVWVAELYSFDAVSILGYLAGQTERMELASGILPLYSRTPTLTAMTAAGLDAVSEGRFVLGLGASGPQVIEGWHGVPYTKPLTATKEIIDICRKVWKRERVEYDGELYKLPLPPDQGTGLGKPLKIINHPVRENIPIYLASLGPKNVQMTAEIADGWLPAFFHPDKAREVFGPDLDAGAARRDPSLAPLEIVAGGTVAITNDADVAKKIRDRGRGGTALYVGGMGAKGKNFYNNVFRRYGYEAEAEKIQDLYLSGQKAEAEALVPDDYLEATALVGDEGRVRERIEAYKAAGVTRLSITPVGDDPLALIEKVKAWAD
ncbi:MAG TPA: LLM class F420-dependent oxidoreductase [Acidimicrobiales bacterium]|jgi:F420-dependent oxidoreductase-like protein|nr:LLM class F420-dependent oxidoreductase [Acidimicrobiales bacterium]